MIELPHSQSSISDLNSSDKSDITTSCCPPLGDKAARQPFQKFEILKPTPNAFAGHITKAGEMHEQYPRQFHSHARCEMFFLRLLTRLYLLQMLLYLLLFFALKASPIAGFPLSTIRLIGSGTVKASVSSARIVKAATIKSKNLLHGTVKTTFKAVKGIAQTGLQVVKNHKISMTLVLALASLRLGSNAVEAYGRNVAVQGMLNHWFVHLPSEVKRSDWFLKPLSNMTRNFMCLMCQFKNSRDPNLKAIADNVHQKLNELPGSKPVSLALAVKLVCLGQKLFR